MTGVDDPNLDGVSTDPNVWDISYQYDDVGNLLNRADALGQTQTFEYGMANRLVAAYMSNPSDPSGDYSYFYHYDAPARAAGERAEFGGKLAWVEWPTGTHHVSYDDLGRLEAETQTLWDGVVAR